MSSKLYQCGRSAAVKTRAANDPSVFTIMENATNRAFPWLKVPTSAFTFKTLLKTCYAQQAPKLGKGLSIYYVSTFIDLHRVE